MTTEITTAEADAIDEFVAMGAAATVTDRQAHVAMLRKLVASGQRAKHPTHGWIGVAALTETIRRLEAL